MNSELADEVGRELRDVAIRRSGENLGEAFGAALGKAATLRDFVIDRLEVELRGRDIPADYVRAARRHLEIDTHYDENEHDGPQTYWAVIASPFVVMSRVAVLNSFLASTDGTNLLAGYKRAANILKAEEKKEGKNFFGNVEVELLVEAEERALAEALLASKGAVASALATGDFEGAVRAMALLRAPVDSFFDNVKVNVDDLRIRENRLNLLSILRASLHGVADFSKIEG